MSESAAGHPAPALAEARLDRHLLLSITLSPLGAGISTVVGFTVAHWITLSAHKQAGYLVSASCLSLCAVAASLAWNAQRKLPNSDQTIPDETVPKDGRRLFMAKLALLLSAFCTVVILAGILVVVILGPSD